MREEELSVKSEKSFWEGRAAITGVIAVTVFLCFFTVFEILVIKMEWDLPVMRGFIGGSDNFIFSQYREEEEQLELSTENEVTVTEQEYLSVEQAEDMENSEALVATE